MTCKHLQNGVCLVASKLAEVDVRPLLSQCEYCTQKALPPQDINKITVSIAFKANAAKRSELFRKHKSILAPDLVAQQREHWRKIHTTQMDEDSFKKWLTALPKCDCLEAFLAILKINPPRFDDWFMWTWEIHNAVNAKLSKPEVTWDDAAKLWNWNRQHNKTTGK